MKQDGVTNRVLAQEPAYKAVLIAVALRDSLVSEMHEGTDDIYYVLEGNRKITVGGALVAARPNGPGEWLGGNIEGGKEFFLQSGDVLHIPRGTPHMLHLGHEWFSYLIVKVYGVPNAE
ncbi:MAG: hypothetical protein V1784_08190 [bacterium]